MELSYRRLTEEEIATALQGVKGWVVTNGEVAKSWQFSGYNDGLIFATCIGAISDGMDHHPNILIGYKTVTVSMNTHSVEGISPYDFELARRIDSLYPS